MKLKALLIALLALAWLGGSAYAASMCAGSAGIAQTSVQLKAAGDISAGRHHLSVQNMGPVMLCCGIGTGNAVSTACTNGFLLLPTQEKALDAPATGGALPDGDISCIAPTGVGSASACDY